MFSENLNTKRNPLDVLSNIRNIYRDIKKETIYLMRYLNDILLGINIELTYNTLISSKVAEQLSSEEEEKKIIESYENHPNSVYDKPISVSFFTNLSSDRIGILSTKLAEIIHLSKAKDKKILELNKIMKLISTLIKEMEETTLRNWEESKNKMIAEDIEKFRDSIADFLYQLKDHYFFNSIMNIISKNYLAPSERLMEKFKSSKKCKKLCLPEFEYLNSKIEISQEKYDSIKEKLKQLNKSILYSCPNKITEIQS